MALNEMAVRAEITYVFKYFKYTEISQTKRLCILLTLKNRSINIYATCVKSHIADDQISHIINQVPDFVHLRILSAFQTETRRK